MPTAPEWMLSGEQQPPKGPQQVGRVAGERFAEVRQERLDGPGFGDERDQPDVAAARGLGTGAETPLVLKEPSPLIKISELAESSVNFVVRPWVKRSDYFTFLYDITAVVKKEFDREGVSFPFPQREIHVHQAGS